MAESRRFNRHNERIGDGGKAPEEKKRPDRRTLLLGCAAVSVCVIMGFFVGMYAYVSYEHEKELERYPVVRIVLSDSDAYYDPEADGYTVTDLRLLQSDRITLRKGESLTLSAEIVPSDVPQRYVRWSSNDKNVVTVDENGRVTAVDDGQATVTATVGDFDVRCLIIVSDGN